MFILILTVYPLIEAGSHIQAGSLIQAGGQTSFVPIEAGGFYYRKYGNYHVWFCCVRFHLFSTMV